MIGQFFRALVGNEKKGELETQIWECISLLVADKDGKVVFAKDTNIEFTPNTKDEKTGHAISLTSAANGSPLEIEIAERIDVLRTKSIEMWSRGGVTLLGTDAEGNDVGWYISECADTFMLEQDEHAAGSEKQIEEMPIEAFTDDE